MIKITQTYTNQGLSTFAFSLSTSHKQLLTELFLLVLLLPPPALRHQLLHERRIPRGAHWTRVTGCRGGLYPSMKVLQTQARRGGRIHCRGWEVDSNILQLTTWLQAKFNDRICRAVERTRLLNKSEHM